MVELVVERGDRRPDVTRGVSNARPAEKYHLCRKSRIEAEMRSRRGQRWRQARRIARRRRRSKHGARARHQERYGDLKDRDGCVWPQEEQQRHNPPTGTGRHDVAPRIFRRLREPRRSSRSRPRRRL